MGRRRQQHWRQRRLAKTGVGFSTTWTIAGSAGALALGTGLVVMARRRVATPG